LIYVAAVLLVLILAVVLRAQLNVWGGRPVTYPDLELDQITAYVRSWGPWLEERGRIVIRHAGTDVEAELRKHRFATRPDVLILRVRNADTNKSHFEVIRNAFDAARISYELETTAKTHQPRAISIPLVADDLHAPAAARRLLEEVFNAVGIRSRGFMVHAEGSMRRVPDAPTIPLIPWRQDQRAGYLVGERLGRAVKRILG
jgi:hypothetical protein